MESSEKSYVDQKLTELLAELSDGVPSPKHGAKTDAKRRPKGAGSNRVPSRPPGRTMRSEEELHGLVQYIRQHDNIDAVDHRVLSSSSQLPRILMCLFYGGQQFDDPYLTTGEVEFVTDQLGVRIKRSNAAQVLKKNPKFVTTDAVRKKGAVVGYKLTRNGTKHFAGLLDDKEQ